MCEFGEKGDAARIRESEMNNLIESDSRNFQSMKNKKNKNFSCNGIAKSFETSKPSYIHCESGR